MVEPKKVKSYGTWPSPVTPEITGLLRELSEPAWAAGGHLLWREQASDRADLMILRSGEDQPVTLTPEISIGGGVLYGGGSFSVRGRQAVAVEKGSGRLLTWQLPGGKARLLAELPGRAASPRIAPDGKRVLFVHSHQDEDSIHQINPAGGGPALKLITGADFYNFPRWHPGGKQIAWMCWDHPAMPWDSSRIHLGRVSTTADQQLTLADEKVIAGGEGTSAVQPEFSPDGKHLAYVSDRSGWWQLYIYQLESGQHRQLTFAEAEHGLPAWLQDMRTFAFSNEGSRIYFLRNQEGCISLWELDLAARKEQQIELNQDYTWLGGISVSPEDDTLALIASQGTKPQRLITLDRSGLTNIVRQAYPGKTPEDLFSNPRSVSWDTGTGTAVHGLFYPPHHPDYTGEGRPPLLVLVHSGPTRQKWAEFEPRVQYFTSRGYAVLVVNYRGSTGYGRAYREALYGEWGLVDVWDCVSGAQYAVDRGWVDPGKMAIMGSSAGGLTVLRALIEHPGVFQAGISMYGVVNHLTLLDNPPKFERDYSQHLLGPYPQEEEIYRQRSPLFFVDQIRDPVIIFQGGKDPVVPRKQAEAIVTALQENGVPYEYKLYPEEGHGFKKAENIHDFYHRVEKFLGKHLLNCS
ncbi:MAG: S9 family peptidase [Anaerolineales bacterium]|nr:S9 family peptidase [Anaerolineales bacterium]